MGYKSFQPPIPKAMDSNQRHVSWRSDLLDLLRRLEPCSKAKTWTETVPTKPFTERAMAVVKFFPLFAVLAFLDLIGTTLAGIGLLFLPSSVYQLFRGSIILFTSLWSVTFLKRKFEWFKWFGIALVVGGLALVGLSGILNNSVSTDSVPAWKYILGILLVILGQMANSTQMIFEEKYLKSANLDALLVIGFEGVFGFLMCLAAAFPIVASIKGEDCGKYENVLDALTMLSQNGFLLAMFLTYYLSISFYNGLGLTVAKLLSSVHRTLIDACRTIFVWISMLIIYYASENNRYGEKWEAYSYIQVIGFTFLAIGTLIYNKVIPVDKWLFPHGHGPAPAEDTQPLLLASPSPSPVYGGSPTTAQLEGDKLSVNDDQK